MTAKPATPHSWLYRMLEPEGWGHHGLSPVNGVLVGLLITSFITLAMETEPTVPAHILDMFDHVNVGIIAIFAVEYGLRVVIAGEDPRYQGPRGRLRYMFSFYALADLMAFLPEAVLMMQGGHMSGQQVALLKALRLLRLFKIARYVPAFKVFLAAIKRSWSQLGVALALAMAFVYVGALLLYFVEGQLDPENFGSIPRALWWAVVTLTTVGYGDVYPHSVPGRLAAAMISLAGIGIVALPAGILASAFSDELRERDHQKAQKKDLEGQDVSPG
jgi:voltage-gated potassium channel